MKRILFFTATILSGMCVVAQTKPTTGFILSLNGGVSSPIGDFSKGDYANEKSGFAGTGGHFNLTGVYYVSKSFGIGVLIGYSQFAAKGTQSLSDGYKEDSGTDSTTLYTKGHSSNLSFLIGPYYSIAVSKKFSIDLRAVGGYVNTHLAGFEIFYEDYTDNAMSQGKTSAGAFGFQLGAGARYGITSNISILANVDYFSSKPKMNISYENFIVNSGRKLNSYNENISGINATLGIAFNLPGK